jgi:hypothetical protein
MFETVTPADVREVIQALLAKAKAGEVASIRELLQRTFGPPESIDLLERINILEAKLDQVAESSRSRRSNGRA